MDIRLATQSEWNKLEENLQQDTVFHTWKWLKIIEKHTKSRFYPIMGLTGNMTVGIYPLFYMKNFIFKSVFSPPPWAAVPYLGPIIFNYNELKQDKKESILIEFQRNMDEFIASFLKPHYVQVKSAPGLLDVRQFKWSGYNVEPTYNYIIDLRQGKDYVWERFRRNLRQNISRAMKCEISIEVGSKDELEWIIDAISERYKEQRRRNSLSKEYVFDLYDAFYPQNMKIIVAKHNGVIVGGMVDLYYKDTVISWLGNTKINFNGISPNELLQWEAIKNAIEHGFKYYLEMGANTERLCRYKSKYNPDLLIGFSAKRYSNKLSKSLEDVYMKIIKPIYYKI